jgi:NTP pyrophosphatase (non-canonical NTP hydrolase)
MADVIIYLIRMADKLNIDLDEAISDKIKKNAIKHKPQS